jgi:2-dehydro-3-deoxy-D-arabinonate dehydratase
MTTPIQIMRWKSDDQLSLGARYEGDDGWLVLSADGRQLASVEELSAYCWSRHQEPAQWIAEQLDHRLTRQPVDAQSAWIPVDVLELWAAGVTYERSREARQAESIADTDHYARVYRAARPELFFKAPHGRVVGPFQPMGLRRDATWHVPEPELTVILDPNGTIFGFTVGNDLTARDIEAENPLYLPQAKLFHNSAAIGPVVTLASTVDPYRLTIRLEVWRHDQCVVCQETTTAKMTRRLDELVGYLMREWPLRGWTGLMTGTGIVPPDEFALEDGDEVRIGIDHIGTLVNTVRLIDPDWVAVPPGPKRLLHIHPHDTVAVSLGELAPGQEVVVGGQTVRVREQIAFGHKIALKAMPKGSPVMKYGAVIGVASRDIEPGEHVHVHNLESQRGRGDLVTEHERAK